jgi:hypothetical protein
MDRLMPYSISMPLGKVLTLNNVRWLKERPLSGHMGGEALGLKPSVDS